MSDADPAPISKSSRRIVLRQTLVERFPNCFAPKGQPKRPLAVGIREAIIEACPDLTADDIKVALQDYTRGAHSYRSQFFFGAERIDQTGAAVGVIDASAAAHAGAMLMDAGHVEAALAIARSLPAELAAA